GKAKQRPDGDGPPQPGGKAKTEGPGDGPLEEEDPHRPGAPRQQPPRPDRYQGHAEVPHLRRQVVPAGDPGAQDLLRLQRRDRLRPVVPPDHPRLLPEHRQPRAVAYERNQPPEQEPLRRPQARPPTLPPR